MLCYSSSSKQQRSQVPFTGQQVQIICCFPGQSRHLPSFFFFMAQCLNHLCFDVWVDMVRGQNKSSKALLSWASLIRWHPVVAVKSERRETHPSVLSLPKNILCVLEFSWAFMVVPLCFHGFSQSNAHQMSGNVIVGIKNKLWHWCIIGHLHWSPRRFFLHIIFMTILTAHIDAGVRMNESDGGHGAGWEYSTIM